MQCSFVLLLITAVVVGQDVGGRDTGKGKRPVIFVRSARDAESAAIYRCTVQGALIEHGVGFIPPLYRP